MEGKTFDSLLIVPQLKFSHMARTQVKKPFNETPTWLDL